MLHPNIRRLYKYAPLSERTLSVLLTGQVWYAAPSTFNDPFDSSIADGATELLATRTRIARQVLYAMQLEPKDEAARAIFDQMRPLMLEAEKKRAKEMADTVRPMVQELSRMFHSFGVLCLSEDPANILMWSHYAAQHTGVCLGFQRISRNHLGTLARPVNYTRNRISGKKMNPIYDKHDGWRHEREWRDIQGEGNRLYPAPGKLVEVVCGAKMSVGNVDLLRRTIAMVNTSGSAIALKQARMHYRRYVIEITNDRADA